MAEVDLEPSDVIAFVSAHVRGDQEACRALLGATDGVKLLGFAIEFVVELACRELPGGRAELERLLTSWQVRRRGSLLD